MITAENHAQGMPPVVLEGVLVAGFDAQLLDELNLSDVTVFALAGSDDAARLHLERSHFREAHQLPGGLLLLRTGGLEISIGPAIART